MHDMSLPALLEHDMAGLAVLRVLFVPLCNGDVHAQQAWQTRFIFQAQLTWRTNMTQPEQTRRPLKEKLLKLLSYLRTPLAS